MKYKTPNAFEMALVQHLQARHRACGMAIDRLRQLIAFDRLVARLSAAGLEYLTKGGFVLELRLERARTTRDVDISLYGDPARLGERVAAACALDLGDFFRFRLAPPTKASLGVIGGPGVRYAGQRFVCTCSLGGKEFTRFGLDVAVADPPDCTPEYVDGLDWLAFAGVAMVRHPVLSREHHIAQKLHAYTLPRPDDRPNSRLKDLPDLVLLASAGPIRTRAVRAAIEATFSHRATHAPPSHLPPPPAHWAEGYPEMAADIGLTHATLDDVLVAARAFVDPILASNDDAEWDPIGWVWRAVA
ncbi:MAG: nucleotidyl transferase AbiEii/AbiGii toxin family protein [bacterium]